MQHAYSALKSTYITSKYMGNVCKCKQSFWTLHNSFFHKPIHSFVMISILIFFGYSVKSIGIICSVHFFRVPWIRKFSLRVPWYQKLSKQKFSCFVCISIGVILSTENWNQAVCWIVARKKNTRKAQYI